MTKIPFLFYNRMLIGFIRIHMKDTIFTHLTFELYSEEHSRKNSNIPVCLFS